MSCFHNVYSSHTVCLDKYFTHWLLNPVHWMDPVLNVTGPKRYTHVVYILTNVNTTNTSRFQSLRHLSSTVGITFLVTRTSIRFTSTNFISLLVFLLTDTWNLCNTLELSKRSKLRDLFMKTRCTYKKKNRDSKTKTNYMTNIEVIKKVKFLDV